jgi:hypothetical protein
MLMAFNKESVKTQTLNHAFTLTLLILFVEPDL